jgi:hypothetical protein
MMKNQAMLAKRRASHIRRMAAKQPASISSASTDSLATTADTASATSSSSSMDNNRTLRATRQPPTLHIGEESESHHSSSSALSSSSRVGHTRTRSWVAIGSPMAGDRSVGGFATNSDNPLGTFAAMLTPRAISVPTTSRTHLPSSHSTTSTTVSAASSSSQLDEPDTPPLQQDDTPPLIRRTMSDPIASLEPLSDDSTHDRPNGTLRLRSTSSLATVTPSSRPLKPALRRRLSPVTTTPSPTTTLTTTKTSSVSTSVSGVAPPSAAATAAAKAGARGLRAMMLVNVLFALAFAVSEPSLLAAGLGLRPSSSGLLWGVAMAAHPFAKMFAAPVWGFLSDGSVPFASYQL